MASRTIYLLPVIIKAANLEKELPVLIFQYYVTLLVETVQGSAVLYFTITYQVIKLINLGQIR
jgi:hypothetical protein